MNVAVRCRPMSEKEIADGYQSIVDFEESTRIVVHEPGESPSDQLGTKSGERKNLSHVFDFNAVFRCAASQQEVYDSVCRPIVDSVLQGYNGTMFAYGQTGTGKTYTMEGKSSTEKKLRQQQNSAASRQSSGKQVKPRSSSAKQAADKVAKLDKDEESQGIIPRTFRQIFEHVNSNSNVQFLIRASYLEIYQEEIYDLLRKDRSMKLELHERPDSGVYVKDLSWFVCKSITEIERVMRVGNQNRKVGATDMNEHSSRSHAIFMITVEQQQQQQQVAGSGEKSTDSFRVSKGVNNKVVATTSGRVIRVGKLNLVDLAGSERQRKTNSSGQRQQESIKINLSLSALGNVINSLMKLHTDNNNKDRYNVSSSASNTFTPYRDSKLTRLLQDSLGGNAKTLMIANIGPASYNYDETINTLNYASRAKRIRNRPRLNEDPKDALLRELQREIDQLRAKLAKMSSANAQPAHQVQDQSQVDENVERELLELKRKLASLEGKLLNNDKSSELNQQLLQGYTSQQEAELEKRRLELADQAGREKAIRDELERREEAELQVKQSFSSVQQELDAKRQMIKKVLLRVKSLRDTCRSQEDAYRLELDELDQLQYVLHKELKLKCLIMDNFIPNAHVDQLLPRIEFHERRNCCQVNPIELPLDFCTLNESQIGFHNFWTPTDGRSIRARSEFERTAETINPANIRYKYENLIQPRLLLPERRLRKLVESPIEQETTSSSGDSDNIQKLLEAALEETEADIVI